MLSSGTGQRNKKIIMLGTLRHYQPETAYSECCILCELCAILSLYSLKAEISPSENKFLK